MLNTMNLLWAFNFVKDKSGTGNWDINSYAGVNRFPFLTTGRFSHDLRSLAWSSLLYHLHAPSPPETSARISLGSRSSTMGRQFKHLRYLRLYPRCLIAAFFRPWKVLSGVPGDCHESFSPSLIFAMQYCRITERIPGEWAIANCFGIFTRFVSQNSWYR